MPTPTTAAKDRYTEILQHRIRFFLRGDDAPTELDETSEEHITKLITEGYNQGELCMSVQGEDDDDYQEFRGWWSIESN